MNINKIIDLYKSQRLTQEELAKKSGISKTALSQILLRQSNPKISIVEKIANALNVPVGYFFDDTPEPTPSGMVQVANGHNNKQNIELNTQYKKIMQLEHNAELLKMQMEALKKELALKDKIIKLLEGKK